MMRKNVSRQSPPAMSKRTWDTVFNVEVYASTVGRPTQRARRGRRGVNETQFLELAPTVGPFIIDFRVGHEGTSHSQNTR